MKLKGVDHLLDIAIPETGVEALSDVRVAVTVNITDEQQVRRIADKHSVSPWENAGRKSKSVGENDGGFKHAVPIQIFETFDSSLENWFTCSNAAVRVARHFSDVEPTVGVERHRHGVDDNRLRSDQFDAK